MEELKNYLSVIKKNKLMFLAVLIIIIVIGGFSYLFIGSTYSRVGAYESPGLKGLAYTSYERQGEEKASELLSKPTEYKIKSGSADIKSKNIESDYEKIQKKTESMNGRIESMHKSENYKEMSIRTNLKIPSESFDSFADWLMHNFDVKNANLEFYRIDVERKQDEIQILLEALDVYSRLLDRVEAMNVSRDNIEVIMKITEKKLEIMRLLRSYGYSIEQVEKKSKYASLTVSLTQEKKIELVPEDLGREFSSKLRNSVREIIDAGMDLITVPIVIFVKIIVWIVYAVIVLIPIFIVFKLLLRVFNWVSRKI